MDTGHKAGAPKAPALSSRPRGSSPWILARGRTLWTPLGGETRNPTKQQQMHNLLNPRYFIKFLAKCFAFGFAIGFITVWAWHRLRGRHRLGFWEAVRMGLWSKAKSTSHRIPDESLILPFRNFGPDQGRRLRPPVRLLGRKCSSDCGQSIPRSGSRPPV
jgi:hypothetical protein